MGYKPALETAEQIDPSELDENNRYILNKAQAKKT
jgi:hypothetical protein